MWRSLPSRDGDTTGISCAIYAYMKFYLTGKFQNISVFIKIVSSKRETMKIIFQLSLFITAIFLLSCSGGQKKQGQNIDAAFKDIAGNLSSARLKMSKGTVAVFGFDMIGRQDENYIRYATEKLTNELVEAGKLLVIERSQIDKILKEQNFTLTGVVDAGKAAQIGKILAVEGVVIGSITVMENQIEILARIVQSETGIILKTASFRYSVKILPAENAQKSKNTVIDETDNTSSDIGITCNDVYRSNAPITIRYSGLPGNSQDWITLFEAGRPDNTYGQWFYTNGQRSGSHRFSGVSAGIYEVRVYFDWPSGGYTVQKRVKINVE